jgi:hypothetical protein
LRAFDKLIAGRFLFRTPSLEKEYELSIIIPISFPPPFSLSIVASYFSGITFPLFNLFTNFSLKSALSI